MAALLMTLQWLGRTIHGQGAAIAAAILAMVCTLAPASEYGSGRDGDIVISGDVLHAGGIALLSEDVALADDRRYIRFAHEQGELFGPGDEVLIHANTGGLAGKWVTRRILSIFGSVDSGVMFLDLPVESDFEECRTRISRVIEAESFIIEPGARYFMRAGSPTVIAIKSRTSMRIDGTLDGTGRRRSTWPNVCYESFDTGPGPGRVAFASYGGSSGAGHAATGIAGGDAWCMEIDYLGYIYTYHGAPGGSMYGSPNLDHFLTTGSSGGNRDSRRWPVGGWALLLASPALHVNGLILASGESAPEAEYPHSSKGGIGGASGGAVWIRSVSVLGSGFVSSLGGLGGEAGLFSDSGLACRGELGDGGDGAPGRVQVNADYLDPDLQFSAGSLNFQQGLFPNESVSWMMY